MVQVKYCDLLDQEWAKRLGTDKKFVPRQLFDILSVSTFGVRELVAEIETLFDYATPCWRSECAEEKKTTKLWELQRTHSLAKRAISNINVYRASH